MDKLSQCLRINVAFNTLKSFPNTDDYMKTMALEAGI